MSYNDSYQDVDFWEGEVAVAEAAVRSAKARAQAVLEITAQLEASGASNVWVRLSRPGWVSCTLSVHVDRMDDTRAVLDEVCCSHGVRVGSTTFYPCRETT
ncbi:MAG: hypothetical protein ACRBN8_22550 [Nannocystales bacterium]